MNRTKFLTVMIIALLVLNLGTLGYLFMRGGDGGPPPHHRKGGPSAFIIKKLKFTPEQEEKFIDLRDAHRSTMHQLADSLMDLQEIYFNGLKTNTVDTTTANRNAAEITRVEMQMHQVTFNHFVEVRKLCTPEQQKQFDEFITDVIHSMSPPPPGAPPR